MRLIVTILFLQLMVGQAFGSVNLRNGSYAERWTDFIDPGDGYEMKITRFYSSRSLYIGIFGFGWCTELETYLTITSDGIINLTECGGGLEVTYFPQQFEKDSSAQTIKTILAHLKKEKGYTPTQLSNLRVQLRANEKLRFKHANQLGLVDIRKIKAKNNTFLAKTKGFERITFNGKVYERRKSNGEIQQFNQNGKLIKIINKTGQYIDIVYKGSKIQRIRDNQGRQILFTFGKDGKLAKLSNGRGLESSFKFSGQNLIEVYNMWKKKYVYHYDQNHNLTQVDFPDDTKIEMSYDINNDWVISYKNRKDCRETYDFILDPQDPKNTYTAKFERKCAGSKKVEQGYHKFWYKNYAFSKDKYLDQVVEKYPDHFKDVRFHPYLGRAISIHEDNVYQGFAYYLNGLVNKKEQKIYNNTQRQKLLDWFKSTFKYDFEKILVKAIETDHFTPAGKKTKTELTYFKYTKRGNLTKALRKGGKFVSIDYNTAGKVKKLANEKNQFVELTYDKGSSKPTGIEVKNLGKITIEYNNRDEIVDVTNNSKRNVASSVIEIFMEMLSFIGPVGESIKI